MKPKFKNAIPGAIVLAFVAVLPAANAVVWDGSDSTDWDDDFNWVGGVAPVSGDVLEFSGAATAIVNQPTDNTFTDFTSFSGIDFTNDGTVGTLDAIFTLDGRPITLGGNITTTTTSTAASGNPLADTIEFGLLLDANRTILTKTGHTLSLNGDISGDFNLLVGDNNAVGDEALLTLSGDNSHALTDIGRNADVRVESNTGLGLSAIMRRGSSLSLSDGLDLTVANGLTVVNGGAPSQAISLNGPGTLNASISATTTVTNLNFSQSLNFVVGEDDTLTVNGILSGVSGTANEAEIRKSNLGTLVLTNPANDYIAEMRVLGGTLLMGGAGRLGDPASNLRMGGGNLDLGGTTQTVTTVLVANAAASGDAISNGSFSDTNFTAFNAAGNAIISADLTGSGNFLRSAGAGTVTLSGTNTYTGTTTSRSGSLVTANSAALPGFNVPGQVIFDGGNIGVQVGPGGWTQTEVATLLDNSTQTSGGLGIDTTNGDFTLATEFGDTSLGLTKLGPNALTLSGDNSYSGNTSLLEGTLNLGSDTALGIGDSNLFIASGTTIDNTSGSAITLANNPTVVLPGDGFTFGGSGDLNFGTGAVTLNLPPNNTTRTITLGGTGRTVTFGGDSFSAARGGNTNIEVNGAGNTLVFGSLGLNNAAANRVNAWSGSADVTVNGGVLDGGNGGQAFVYSGTGTFTIGGASTYTGNTTVESGTLALAAGGELSDSSNVILNGGMIDLASGVSDRIASLTIIGVNGGAPLPDGEYGSTASNGPLGEGALDGFLTGSGVFVISSSPFESFAGAAGFNGDANGDGISNGLAFVLGAANINANARSLQPIPVESGGELSTTFTQVSAIAPARLFVEFGGDLGTSEPWERVEIPAASGTVGDVTFVITPNGRHDDCLPVDRGVWCGGWPGVRSPRRY